MKKPILLFLGGLAAGIILTGLAWSLNLDSTRAAFAGGLTMEIVNVNEFSVNAYKNFSASDNIAAQNFIISFIAHRKKINWISRPDYDRTKGLALARIGFSLAELGKSRQSETYLGKALTDLRLSGLDLSKEQLVSLIGKERKKQ